VTPPWWRTAVTYQVYLRSFADGDGDGVGDLAGLRARLDHLQRLGVDALWITPWYRSPMHDGGYDVADHCDIDPLFGTLDQARALLAELHERGLRLVIDVVANHTSSEHPWFRAAVAAPPGSPERARYHLRDGAGPDGDRPPNDWISAFGGSAWTRLKEPDGRPGQWYLHLFAPEQPDLNWDHPDVHAAYEKILRFWLDLGVDGLRVDAAPGLAKLPGLPDHGFAPGEKFAPMQWGPSPLWDVDAVHDIYRTWRAIADEYPGDRLLVGEVPVNGSERLARYVRPGELHTVFDLELIEVPWRATALRRHVGEVLAAMDRVGAAVTWVLSSHDAPRHVTRYGRAVAGGGPGPGPTDLELGVRRARAALLLELALPGGACLYQGEELGLGDVEDLPAEALRDPIRWRAGGTLPVRDGCRVPLPWSGTAPPFGFSTGSVRPWLPQPAAWAGRTVAAQEGDPSSVLSLYRAALALRRRLVAAVGGVGGAGGELEWLPAPQGVVAFERGGGWRCVVNVDADPVPLTGRVLLASGPLDEGEPLGSAPLLPRDTAAWTSP